MVPMQISFALTHFVIWKLILKGGGIGLTHRLLCPTMTIGLPDLMIPMHSTKRSVANVIDDLCNTSSKFDQSPKEKPNTHI